MRVTMRGNTELFSTQYTTGQIRHYALAVIRLVGGIENNVTVRPEVRVFKEFNC